jgi:putative endonuclease
VEVKTRRNDHYGSPEEAITRRKMEHIRHTALSYLSEHEVKYKHLRFDVIAILMKDSTPIINHIEAAF